MGMLLSLREVAIELRCIDRCVDCIDDLVAIDDGRNTGKGRSPFTYLPFPPSLPAVGCRFLSNCADWKHARTCSHALHRQSLVQPVHLAAVIFGRAAREASDAFGVGRSLCMRLSELSNHRAAGHTAWQENRRAAKGF